jgi:hypothetical protein
MTASIPAVPVPTSPGTLSQASEPTLSSSTVTLSWSASSGATSYEVAVRNLNTNQLVVDQTVSGTSYTASLSPGGSYRWNVDAIDSAGASSFSSPLYFLTAASVSIPAVPVPTSPGTLSQASEPTLSSSTVTLSWSASSGATSYEVAVRDLNTNQLVVDQTVSGTSYTASLSPGGSYRWNVDAIDSAGASSFSSPLYFLTAASVSIPAVPVPTSPGTLSQASEPTLSSSTVTLSWSASSGATSYEVAVRDLNTNQIVVDQTVSGTSYTASLSPGGSYRWNVDAIDSAGASSFSSPLYFLTAASVSIPAVPVPTSPGTLSQASEPTLSSSTVTLSWSASSGATSYEVAVRDLNTNQLVVDQTVSGTSYTASLSPGGSYRWNVDAIDSAGASSFSSPLYFLTAAVASDTVLDNANTQAVLATTATGKIDAEPMAGSTANVSDNHGGFVDKDWFKVTLDKSKVYTFSGNATSITTGLMDISLYGQNGTQLHTAVEGANPSFTFDTTYQTSATQNYYLAVSAGGSEPTWRTATGNYSVSLSGQIVNPTADQIPKTIQSNVPLSIGTTTGTIDSADISGGPDDDYYRVTLNGGEKYTFIGSAGASAADTLDSVVIRLRDANGNILSTGDKTASGPNPSFDYTVPGTGPQNYFFAISASSAGSSNGVPTDQKTGQYSITLKDDGLATQQPGFHIHLIPDQSVLDLQGGENSSFALTVRHAADLIEQTFTDNITLNIRYGWGTFNNNQDASLNGFAGAEGAPVAGDHLAYSTLKNWLSNDPSRSLDDSKAIASLPGGDSVNGYSTFFVSSAQEKAFGHFVGNSANIDGAVGFGTLSTSDFWLGAALHELTHAIGRTTQYYSPHTGFLGLFQDPTIMDLYRYDSTGHFQWNGGQPAYFSIDGGKTPLANFSDSSEATLHNTITDYGDWLGDPLSRDSPFRAFSSGANSFKVPLDVTAMDVIGYDTAPLSTISSDSVQDATIVGNGGLLALVGSITGTVTNLFVDSVGTLGRIVNNITGDIKATFSQFSEFLFEGGIFNDLVKLFPLSGSGIDPKHTVFFNGNDGDDTLDGSATDTSIVAKGGNGNDALTGGFGDDTFSGGPGNDTINGGPGSDTTDYSDAKLGLVVNLSLAQNQAIGPEIGTDQISNIENVIGGSGDDRISGDANANALAGGAGNDILVGDAQAPVSRDITAALQGTIVQFDSTGFDATRVQNASVVKTASGYAMLYGGLTFGNNYQIGLATSSDGLNWSKYSADPVISNGGSQSWASFREFPATLMLDNGVYKLWFNGDNSNLSSDPGYKSGFGYATSPDGINWSFDAGNPIRVELNSPSGNGIDLNEVVKLNGQYIAYYVNHNPSGDVLNYATSADGIHFANDAPLSVPAGYSLLAATTANISGANTVFAVFQDSSGVDHYATSTDGASFTIGGIVNVPSNFSMTDVLFDGSQIKFFGDNGVGNVNWGFGNINIEYATALVSSLGGNSAPLAGGNDILDGGPGNDTIDGGPGFDTAVFSGLRSAYTITHIGNGLQVSGPDGLDTLTHVERLAFDDATIPLSPAHDLDGDGNSDAVLQNANGATYFWEMNGLGIKAHGAGPTVDPSWHIVSTKADLDGDGNSDVVLQNLSGATYFWEMNGLGIKAHGAGPTVDPSWHIVGTGDLDGDGKGDIVLQNTSGATYFWLMDGPGVKAHGAGPTVDPSWHIVGTGDLDADGKSDIVLQNTNGSTYFWEMDGLGVKAHGAGPAVNPSWHIVGTGDLDADGKSDIVLQNTGGATYLWEMDGLGIKAHGAGPAVDPSWHIVQTGDLDADGKSDIVLHNDNGATYFWEMDGLNVKAHGGGPAIDPSWHIL